MATPNYQQEKRQRDLAKSKKKAEKRQRKAGKDTQSKASPDQSPAK
ncbi:MAG: hypothetical protein M3463_08780 [Verrucomicrobiota bacterium]|nr:hypothetical protein [Verrucomicrobiota bacterium]